MSTVNHLILEVKFFSQSLLNFKLYARNIIVKECVQKQDTKKRGNIINIANSLRIANQRCGYRRVYVICL